MFVGELSFVPSLPRLGFCDRYHYRQDCRYTWLAISIGVCTRPIISLDGADSTEDNSAPNAVGVSCIARLDSAVVQSFIFAAGHASAPVRPKNR